MHKVVFIPVIFPRGVVLGYFLSTFANHFTFCVLLLLENHSISSHQFFSRYSWHYSEGYLANKNLKRPYSLSLSAQIHFQVFEGSFGDMFLYFLRAALSYLMKLFFFYYHSQCARKNFTAYIPQLKEGVFCSIIGTIFSIFLHAMRNLKHSLNILHESLDIAVVTTLKNELGLPLL